METTFEEPATPASDGLKLLFEYTKFHIGLYTSAIALVLFESLKVTGMARSVASAGAILLLCAAGCGGVVAGNVHLFGTLKGFKTTKIGPFGRRWAVGERWETREHFFFWCAAMLLVLGHVAVGLME